MSQQSKALIVAHRGTKGLVAENTLDSFAKVLKFGVSAIETDVRVTKDNVVILSHDSTVAAGEHELIVSESTFKELRAAKPDLATLQDALTSINRQAKLMLEVKPKVNITPIVKLIKAQLKKKLSYDDFCFASFDYKILQKLHQELPAAEYVVLDHWSPLRAINRAKRLPTKYLSINRRFLWWGYVRFLSKNFKVYTYTLNNHNKAAVWQKHGLYGIITDAPDRYHPPK